GGALTSHSRRRHDGSDLVGAKLHDRRSHGVDAGEDLGPRLFGRAAAERLRVIFDSELDALGDVTVAEVLDDAEGEVDARGDAAAGEAVAIEDHPRLPPFGAEACEVLAPGPVTAGAIALQQPGCSEDQRAGADTGDELGALGLPLQP